MKLFYNLTLAIMMACFSLSAAADGVTAKIHDYKNWVVCLTFDGYSEVDYNYDAEMPIRIFTADGVQVQSCYDASMDDDVTNMVLCTFDDPIDDGNYVVKFGDGTFLADPWGKKISIPGAEVSLVVGDASTPELPSVSQMAVAEYTDGRLYLLYPDYAGGGVDLFDESAITVTQDGEVKAHVIMGGVDDDQSNLLSLRLDAELSDGVYTVEVGEGGVIGDMAGDPWDTMTTLPAHQVTLVVGEGGEGGSDSGDVDPEVQTWFGTATPNPASGETVENLNWVKFNYGDNTVWEHDGYEINFVAGTIATLSLDGETTATAELEFSMSTFQSGFNFSAATLAPGKTYTLSVPAGAYIIKKGGKTVATSPAETFTYTIAGGEAVDPEQPSADALTVVSLTSSAAGGIVLTFSQDVKVSHSAFGTKCYNAITDADGAISTLNAKPTAAGNVVTLTQQYCTFVDGHHITLELNPTCFTAVADPSISLTGQTTFEFVMGEGNEKEEIVVLNATPSNGTRTNLANITVTFEPGLTEIVDKAGITVENENGTRLPLVRVNINNEGGVSALNINVDTDKATYEGGTTYKLHIAAGAIKCGETSNSKELVVGDWYIKPTPLALVTTPASESVVESLSSVTIAAADGLAFDYVGTTASDITITGVMEDQTIVYATATSVEANADGTAYTVTFDKAVTPEDIAAAAALYNSVKINVPAATFKRGVSENNAFQVIWTVQHQVEIGEVTWTFNPAADSTVEALGTPVDASDENGVSVSYVINFTITADNLFASIPDASAFKMVNENTGATVMTFDKYAVTGGDDNSFTLEFAKQLREAGQYTLIIPAAAVLFYTDANHYSEPQHPEADVEVTWTVDPTLGISSITLDAASARVFNLQGQRVSRTQQGVYIVGGKKMVK